jgi:hypothetical protein
VRDVIKNPKPVKAYCIVVNGELWPCWTNTDKKILAADWMDGSETIIRGKIAEVIVRIAPKKRKLKNGRRKSGN